MNKGKKKEHISKTKYGLREYIALFACVAMGVIMLVFAFSAESVPGENGDSSEDEHIIIDLQSGADNEEMQNSSAESSEEENLYDIINVSSEGVCRGDLILVSNKHPYTFKDETELINVYGNKKGKYYLASGKERLYEKTILVADKFLQDFYDVSGRIALMSVGYLSEEEQNAKYERYIKSVTPEEAQKWGVKAGGSDHHTGLSFNLSAYSGGKIGEGEYAWITENAYRYGFILRYPQDKSEITSVKDNNHFRYVGIPHAEYMYMNNLTLEEYVYMLEETTYKTPLNIKSGNKEYSVYYAPADKTSSETEIKIPKGMEYSVSGNNIEGFIVTISLASE